MKPNLVSMLSRICCLAAAVCFIMYALFLEKVWVIAAAVLLLVGLVLKKAGGSSRDYLSDSIEKAAAASSARDGKEQDTKEKDAKKKK